MSKTSSSSLSRGRTLIDRRHVNVGNVIHEARDAIEYVHLRVIKGMSLDVECTDDLVIVNDGSAQDVQLRVLIGENAEALLFTINCKAVHSEMRLADNLCVHPYEQVIVSISDPSARLIVNGIVTDTPVLR